MQVLRAVCALSKQNGSDGKVSGVRLREVGGGGPVMSARRVGAERAPAAAAEHPLPIGP